MSASQYGLMFVLRVVTITNPGSINVIGFFMNTQLQDGTVGASLSYSLPPDYSGLVFIGAIANVRPSDIFHTGWSLNPSINQLSELKLIVQIEPLSQIETQVAISQETQLA